MFDLGALKGQLILGLKNWTSNVKTALTDIKKIKQSLNTISDGLKKVGRVMTFVGGVMVAGFTATLRASMKAEEAMNLFRISMGKFAEEAKGWASEITQVYGLHETGVRTNLGVMNIMLKSLGLNDEAAFLMGKSLTQLAFDLRSFHDLATNQEAFQKLKAGITGLVLPMRGLGTSLLDSQVKAFALQHGISQVGEEMTLQQKIVARYGIMIESQTAAVGDLARTAHTLTNQWIRFRESMKQVVEILGNSLRPVATEIITILNTYVTVGRKVLENNEQFIGNLITITAKIALFTTGLGLAAFAAGSLLTAITALAAVATTTFGVLFVEITAVLAALVFLGTGLFALRAAWKADFLGITTVVKAFASDVVDIFDSMINKIVDLFPMMGEDWTENLRSMAAPLKAFVIDTLAILAVARKAIADPVKFGIRSAFSDPFEEEKKRIIDDFGDIQAYFKFQFVPSMKRGAKEAFESVGNSLAALKLTGKETSIITVMKKQFKEDLEDLVVLFQNAAPETSAKIKKLTDDWKRFKEELSSVDIDLESLATVEAVLQTLTDDMNAARIAKSQATGRDFFSDIFPARAIIDDINAGLQGLSDLGILQGDFFSIEGRGILAKALWEQLKSESDDVILAVIAGLSNIELQADLTALAVEAMDKKLTDASKLKALESARNLMDANRQAVDELHSSFNRLGGDLRNLGDYMGSEFLSDIGDVTLALEGAVDAFERLTEGSTASSNDLVNSLNEIANAANTITTVLILIEEIAEALDEAKEEAMGFEKVFQEIANSVESWADQMTDAIVEFTKTGKLSFRDMAESIASDLLKLSIKYGIIEPLIGGFPQFAKGGVFDSGNIVPFATGGVVSKPTFFPLSNGNTGVMGEKGTEGVFPLDRMANGDLGVNASGIQNAPTNVQVNIINEGDDLEVKQQSIRQEDGQTIIDLVVENKVRRMLRDGTLDNEMGLFGAVRKGA